MSSDRSPNQQVRGSVRGWGRTFEALANRRFRLLWLGTLLTFGAGQMTLVVRPWLAFEISGSAFSLGLVAAAQGVPMVLASPFGGVAADRLSKRTVILISQAVLMAVSAVVAALIVLDLVEVWHLAVLALVHGTTIPFNVPVRQSYIPVLVDRRGLGNAVALQSSGRNLNQVLAPSLGGLLLAWSPAVAFLAIVALHLMAMGMALRLPAAKPAQAAGKGMVGELSTGFRYVLGSPFITTLILMATLAAVLGMPYLQLLAVFQKEVLEVGPRELGFMFSAAGAGALTGSLLVASFSRIADRGYPQLLAGIAFGVGLVLFAQSPIYEISLVLLFLIGMAAQSYMTMNQTLLMSTTDPSLYGRVLSLQMMLRGLLPLSILPIGAFVDRYGASSTVSVLGFSLAAAIVVLGLLRPELRRHRAER